MSITKPRRTADGWVFGKSGAFSDTLFGAKALHEIYGQQATRYTGRVTVPVLWGKQTKQIVSNESADLARMLAIRFDPKRRLVPPAAEARIADWNTQIHS